MTLSLTSRGHRRLRFRFGSLSSSPVVKRSNMSNALKLEVEGLPHHDCNQRLGHLSLPGHEPISTPHYFAVSSRGCVPHLTQDMLKDNTSVKGVYAALEDCECTQ